MFATGLVDGYKHDETLPELPTTDWIDTTAGRDPVIDQFRSIMMQRDTIIDVKKQDTLLFVDYEQTSREAGADRCHARLNTAKRLSNSSRSI